MNCHSSNEHALSFLTGNAAWIVYVDFFWILWFYFFEKSNCVKHCNAHCMTHLCLHTVKNWAVVYASKLWAIAKFGLMCSAHVYLYTSFCYFLLLFMCMTDWSSSNTIVFFFSAISMNLYEMKDHKRWKTLNRSGRLNVMSWKASVIV